MGETYFTFKVRCYKGPSGVTIGNPLEKEVTREVSIISTENYLHNEDGNGSQPSFLGHQLMNKDGKAEFKIHRKITHIR